MLDDTGGGLVEFEDDASGSIEIEEVGVREFFPLKDIRSTERNRRFQCVPCRGLVWVFAVAQITQLLCGDCEPRWRKRGIDSRACELAILPSHLR